MLKAYIEFNNSPLIVVDVAIIRCRKDSDDQREVRVAPLMHLVSLHLSFMSSDDSQQLVVVQETRGSFSSVEVRTASHLVESKTFLTFSFIILDWVRPKKIAFYYLIVSYQKRPYLGGSLKRSTRLMSSIWLRSGEIPP